MVWIRDQANDSNLLSQYFEVNLVFKLMLIAIRPTIVMTLLKASEDQSFSPLSVPLIIFCDCIRYHSSIRSTSICLIELSNV